MNHKLHLALIFHNHQPVGNFDHVFEEAHHKAYRPLVDLMARHPDIRATFHFTGSLREWLIARQPRLYDDLKPLVARGQVEILGGAYYEPILVMLEDSDKIGQLTKLSAAIMDDFDQPPQGMWLAERIWEPGLARPIAEAGLRYAVVDDTHFHYAGFTDDDLYGYYLTEDQNRRLALFPTSQRLRYSIPMGEIDAIIDYLRHIHHTRPGAPLLTMGDDGEKFGLWLGSYQHCWENGWMDAFFDALEANQDWLETTTPARYMAEHNALGRAYLPAASYIEMTEWALPAQGSAAFNHVRQGLKDEINFVQINDPGRADYLETIRGFMRGGFWRNFMVKYPEVNHMQKRSVYISRRAREGLQGEEKAEIMSAIWAAQCNCAYWHGVFGGIYLYHIRAANYTNLLRAHSMLVDDTIAVEQLDFDMDGQDELMVNAKPFSLVIAPHAGGAIFEWDDLPSRYNLLNIMTRHTEAYHIQLQQAGEDDRIITPEMPEWEAPAPMRVRAKEPGLDQHLQADWHRRGMLIDHFLRRNTTLDEFQRAEYAEQGDFVTEPYTVMTDGIGTPSAVITLKRAGNVWVGSKRHPLIIEKRLALTSGLREMTVDYVITNPDPAASLALRYGMEASIGFDGGDSSLCAFRPLRSRQPGLDESLGVVKQHPRLQRYELDTKIRNFRIKVTLSRACTLWRFPLAPVTMSDSGFERVHQGAVYLHVFKLQLGPGENWSFRAHWQVSDL